MTPFRDFWVDPPPRGWPHPLKPWQKRRGLRRLLRRTDAARGAKAFL